MFCRKCGKQIKDGAGFCMYCGTPISTMENAVVSHSTNVIQKNKKKLSKSVIIACVTGVCILAAAAGGILLWTKWEEQSLVDTEDKSEEEDSKSEETFAGMEIVDVIPNPQTENLQESAEPEQSTEKTQESSEASTELPMQEYILPTSNSEFLTMEALAGLTKEDCRIARNELFARHGRLFSDEELQAYFNACSWYEGTIPAEEFDDSVFNEYEVYNRDLIVTYEKEQGYR